MECSLNALPTEILIEVYKYIPLEDKIFTMPKVSKIWRLICGEQDFLELFARHLLKKRISNYNYTDDHVKKIVSLAKNNDLISELKEKKYECSRGGCCGGIKIMFIDKEKQSEPKSITMRYDDWYSSFFNINWSSNSRLSITDEGKCCDLRFSFNVHLDRIRNLNSFSYYDLKSHQAFNIQKRHLFFWKKIHLSPDNTMLCRLIEDAVTLQLKLHSMYLAYKNVIALSKMGINKFEDVESNLSFDCDENGLIKGPHENNELICLNFKKEAVDDEIPVITWNLGVGNELESRNHDIVDFFRLSVFTATVQKLNEKMGTLVTSSYF